MKNINMGEILSPVGNKDMLEAAVRSGADAVYLGAKDFSARRNAENFDYNELKSAIEYCHIRGVRVYLTLNIVIKDTELADAFQLAKTAYNLGIDGIIVQDLGLARILHEKIPELKLHASTQMSVHSPSALPILKDLGFTQVVAAREMSAEELTALCRKAMELDIIVEVFVHGALCMCMSGQCLMSAFLGSRSGNRGLCAGPCRLPFKVENGTGYDLSLKDLSLLEHIPELYRMGVRSFKIEGRMKRPEYVAAATYACRQALDSGRVDAELDKTLKNVFSRSGFTDGYYLNKLGKNMFGIRTKEDVLSADKAFPTLHELYRGERKSVPISVRAEILKGKPIALTVSDGENTVTVLGDIPEAAKHRALTYEDALKNLTKLGSTPYYDEGGSLRLDDGLFVSAGVLNTLRREATEALNQKRAEVKNGLSNAEYIPAEKEYIPPKSYKTIARFESAGQIPEDLSDIDAVLFPLEKDPDFSISLPLIADIPRGITSEDLIENRLQLFKERGFESALCGNLAAVEIATKLGFKIMAGTGLNIANRESLETVRLLGAESAVISSEELLCDSRRLNSPIPKGIIAYGNIPLMLFKNCPLKNGISCKDCDKNGVITDRLGVEFPIRCRMGYSELLNSVPLWLADRKAELDGFDFIILYFTREDNKRAAQVINAYKNGLSPDTKHTRGLYYRGTI